MEALFLLRKVRLLLAFFVTWSTWALIGLFYYQKALGYYESMRKDASEFAKANYFNGYPDTGSAQENFNLIISFIQDSVDKHQSVCLFGSSYYAPVICKHCILTYRE